MIDKACVVAVLSSASSALYDDGSNALHDISDF